MTKSRTGPKWDTETLFYKIIEKTIPDLRPGKSCLIYTGTVSAHGYGQIYNGIGFTPYAHKIVWEHHYGPRTDPDLCVCHSCDVRLCVNIMCLFLGTRADNNRDCMLKGRRPHGEAHYNVKLSTAQVKELREAYAAGGVTLKELGRQYGMHESNIQQIVSGKTRKRG